jgi:hypothetical protein
MITFKNFHNDQRIRCIKMKRAPTPINEAISPDGKSPPRLFKMGVVRKLATNQKDCTDPSKTRSTKKIGAVVFRGGPDRATFSTLTRNVSSKGDAVNRRRRNGKFELLILAVTTFHPALLSALLPQLLASIPHILYFIQGPLSDFNRPVDLVPWIVKMF